MENIKILWTGGWDSTFRIVELSRKEVEIQPIYVLDPNRKSYEYEKIAMKNIIEALKKKEKTKAKILEVKEIKLEDIPQDNEITEAYNKIYEETGLGSQHEWLARLGKQIPGMEIGTEYAEPESSRIINSIKKFTKMEFTEEGIGVINKEQSTKEGCLVLGNFRYPIIKKTELDMLELIKEWNDQDVMKLIWFCHSPVNGKPCGICHPCNVKIESNMEFLLPKKSLEKYRKQKKIKRIFGNKAEKIYTKIMMNINNYKNRKELNKIKNRE